MKTEMIPTTMRTVLEIRVKTPASPMSSAGIPSARAASAPLRAELVIAIALPVHKTMVALIPVRVCAIILVTFFMKNVSLIKLFTIVP